MPREAKQKKYVRFVVGTRGQDTRWLTGVITVGRLKMRHFDQSGRRTVRETFKWLNDHIPCPPFSEKKKAGEWTADAVAWFRTTAREPINRLRPLIQVLRAHGLMVRTVFTNNPGRIVYRDKWQVVAETRR